MQMWVDPEADSSEAAQQSAPPPPVEAFAFAPPWLAAAWADRGAAGLWSTDPPQVGQPRQPRCPAPLALRQQDVPTVAETRKGGLRRMAYRGSSRDSGDDRAADVLSASDDEMR